MKVISLLEPWSSLVVDDEKRWETRPRAWKHEGLVAIHASKGFDSAARWTCYQEPFFSTLRKYGRMVQRPIAGQEPYWDPDFQLGHIIGTVEFVRCVRSEVAVGCLNPMRTPEHPVRAIEGVMPAEHEYDFGNYAAGRYVIVMRNPRRLTTQIPAKGSLGLWTFPDEPILAQLGEPPRSTT